MASSSRSSSKSSLVEIAAFVLRITLGVIFIVHGAQKLGIIAGGSVDATVKGMGAMGIPSWAAYLAIAGEFGGGLGVLFGFLTRIAAAGILSVMTVAILKVHLSNGFFANNHGFEFPLALAAMALYFILAGGGPYSVDRFIRFGGKRH
jgi:putative oxidoreductase